MADAYRYYEDTVCIPKDYTSVPISFETAVRLDIGPLRRGEFIELAMPPRTKDYDSYPEEGIESVARNFDTRHWQSFGADDAKGRAAGLVVARRCPEFEMLENRNDLAVVADLRVRPDARGKGLGRTLMQHALEWSMEQGCREAKVETQDINPGACRFYAAMGFHVSEIHRDAYPPEMDEIQIIWRMILQPND